jgi:hypothetical protein
LRPQKFGKWILRFTVQKAEDIMHRAMNMGCRDPRESTADRAGRIRGEWSVAEREFRRRLAQSRQRLMRRLIGDPTFPVR